VSAALEPFGSTLTVQIFSALQAQGIEEAQACLDEWYR
jgi:hypothetical protein